MKSLDTLDKLVSEAISSRSAFTKHFTKDDIVSYIDYLIDNHRIVAEATNSFSAQHSSKIADMLADTRKANVNGYGQYIDFRKRLKGQASDMEMRFALKSLIEANVIYTNILRDMRDNIDDFFDKHNSKVNLFNMKLSHVIIMGVFHQSATISKYTKYMFAVICAAVEGMQDDIPKYRSTFILDNTVQVAAMTSATIAKAGANDYKGLIKIIKDSANNLNLVSAENASQLKKATLKTNNDMETMMTAGVAGFNPFRVIGELKNRFAEWRKRDRITELEWMKARVALLTAKLDGMDETSKEYKKLKNIVARYEAMINKQERKNSKKKG